MLLSLPWLSKFCPFLCATGLLGGVVYSVSKARESPLSVSTSTKLFDKEDEKSNV
jgi:hypothetical protein